MELLSLKLFDLAKKIKEILTVLYLIGISPECIANSKEEINFCV